MAGHSKWAKIKRDKGANDAKRGAIFTRLGNAIAVAAKSGGDPTMNPSLALAIEKGKAANMPNSNIDKAIKRGTGELGGDIIEEYMFEGYGPGGVGIIVEAASDNRNRTTTEVKTAFNKNGGNMAESGSVAFQFARKGVITVKASGEDALLAVLDAGAEDAVEDDGEIVVYTDMKQLGAVRDAIKKTELEVTDAELQYVPNETITVDDKSQAMKIMKIMDAIEELDDVVNTFSNFDLAEDLDLE
jgi:YebC/PmpR family DNA-binding regulatory protein